MALLARFYCPDSLVSLIVIILVMYPTNSQSTRSNSVNQCLSVDQSECCRINIKMLQDMARRPNSVRPESSISSSRYGMQDLAKDVKEIHIWMQSLDKNFSNRAERCDETVANSTYELLYNFLTYESGKKSSFLTLMAKMSSIERNLQNMSQVEQAISSQMNRSINQSTNLIGNIFQDLMAKQTWNITSLVTLGFGTNSNTQSAILSKLAEGQLREDRKFNEFSDKLEHLKNNVTRPIIQKSTELKQQLERFHQQQNSTSHQQFDNLSTSLQQLRQLQQAEQQRQQLQQLQRYDNLTRQLSDLQTAQRAQQSEQLQMKQLLEQLRQEQQLQKEQLLSNKQQAEEMLFNQRIMNQLLQDIKQKQPPLSVKSRTPANCVEVKDQGLQSGVLTVALHSGVYTVAHGSTETRQVYCDMDTAGGGWTVIQRRKDGSVNFYRNWAEYKNGFGNLTGEFWIGNDRLSQLTRGTVALRVDMTTEQGRKGWVQYQSFSVDSEANNYRLSVRGFSGNAGDSLLVLNGKNFSTSDRDNDGDRWSNKAANYRGAWWYAVATTPSNLNGMYSGAAGIQRNFWQSFNQFEGLKFLEMKIK